MDSRAEVREFLTTRRAKVTPRDVGLPDVGQRRVPGLRRGEVAALAGVSVEYYSKLERGALGGVSASVLDAITGGPAIVRNGRMDLLATNALGRAMHSSLYERAAGPVPNFALYTFLDGDSQRFYADWDTAADTCVAILRTEAGRDRHDPRMHDLVGELATRSRDFRRRWSNHDVRLHGAGSKHFHHTAVGSLDLAYESVDMISEPGLTLTIFAAQPASPTADALALLASWNATNAAAAAAAANEKSRTTAGHEDARPTR